MCKYCNVKSNGYSADIKEGAQIVPTLKYGGCQIVYSEGKYSFEVWGDDVGNSESISFCPFCGRKLK